jgi:hypothetical protein
MRRVRVVGLDERIESIPRGEADLRVRVDERLLRDTADAFEGVQHANFRIDDLLFGRHRTRDDRQMMS